MENVGLELSGTETMVTTDMKKAEALTAFFGSVVTSKVYCQASQDPEPSDRSIDLYPQDWKF